MATKKTQQAQQGQAARLSREITKEKRALLVRAYGADTVRAAFLHAAAMDLAVERMDSHRNGVSGLGFWTVVFSYTEDGERRQMLATILDRDVEEQVGNVPCFVVRISDLPGPDISNWRGDYFYDALIVLAVAGGFVPYGCDSSLLGLD